MLAEQGILFQHAEPCMAPEIDRCATRSRRDMARCETCGNEYDKAFNVTMNGSTHTFDSFECAIHALAPVCEHCGCRVVGHGVEKEDAIYCCVHCAQHEGVKELRDRA
jgi:phage terminase large subunit GpA-like protein